MKIWSFTFGCKVNQYETELLRHQMTGDSGQEVSDFRTADICLINTCSVTAFADKEARQMIRRVLRENAHARVIVTGCYATRAPEEISDISNRIELYTNQQKDELPSCVGYEVADKPLGIHKFSGRTRAFLKIQDGCKAPCNYCIIPTVRPEMRSKSVDMVLKEVKALLAHGYQEIVLTGIRLGLYRGSNEEGRSDLLDLLKQITAIPQPFRIRLSSLEVTELTDSLISYVRDNKKICRHFHIPMQSGSSSVLKAMGRWYNIDFYKDRVRAIRHAMPDCGLTADVMVGYPTETDEDFDTTFKNIAAMKLSGLHVFRFSGRAGTKAEKLMPLDPRIINRRAKVLGELDGKLRQDFYQAHEGSVREVLPEPSGEGWTDNYIRVAVSPDQGSNGLSHMRVISNVFSEAAVS